VTALAFTPDSKVLAFAEEAEDANATVLTTACRLRRVLSRPRFAAR
jgi:hypothetical protein